MGREPFSHTNSKGVKYYLNQKEVTLRGGKVQLIRYFTKDIRPESIDELPIELEVQENPRNGFLTVKLRATDGSSCEDDDDCCCDEGEEVSVEQESPKPVSQYRKLFGRDPEPKNVTNIVQCDGKCCAPVCRSDKSCCESTDTAAPSSAVYDALAKLKEIEYAKKQVKPTMRRCLVEEIKSYAQTDEGNVGASNSVVVSYEYDDGKGLEATFSEVTPPTKVNIREDSYGSFNGNYKQYDRLQLQAHIKNLQTILNTLV